MGGPLAAINAGVSELSEREREREREIEREREAELEVAS